MSLIPRKNLTESIKMSLKMSPKMSLKMSLKMSPNNTFYMDRHLS